MKQLIILRHSKSSWKNTNLSDHERPLNKRGNYDAQLISNYLFSLIQEIDMLHSSSSERTRETSDYFIDKIKIKKIVFDQDLYHISSEGLLNTVRAYDNSLSSAMIIAHNPGLTNFINTLTDLNLYNLPTTGLVIINFNVDSWEEIQKTSAAIYCSKFPKELK